MTPAPRVGDWTLEAKRGEGAGGIVFRAARSDGTSGAFKVARTGDGVGREAFVLARAQRRWGPALLEAGRLDRELTWPGGVLAAGASWMATTWVDGDALDARLARPGSDQARRTLAAIVAHGVGRGLDELHRGGVRHGDVKPANILLAPKPPSVDRASDRGATLVDLDLATDLAQGSLEGGTPRYLAPELRAGDAPGPAADLYALGLVLAEILVPSLARAPELDGATVAEALGAVGDGGRDIAAWSAALVARAPGARPSAAWIADRAARALALEVDLEETLEDRRARVRRAYVAVRAPRIARGARPAAAIDGPARAWLEEALAVVPPPPAASGAEIPPLDTLATARWIVALVGPAAAAWPAPAEGEGALAARLLALAAIAPPEAWTLDDLTAARAPAPPSVASPRPGAPDAPARWVEVTRALAAARPDAGVLERTEEELSRGAAPATLAVDLAGALIRRGEVGRAFAALADRRRRRRRICPRRRLPGAAVTPRWQRARRRACRSVDRAGRLRRCARGAWPPRVGRWRPRAEREIDGAAGAGPP
ncbi:MAG: hypothetical protein KF850_30510 [Labilithrix sp.]|nr:hypothetical protein [Labilithrix sp.]